MKNRGKSQWGLVTWMGGGQGSSRRLFRERFAAILWAFYFLGVCTIAHNPQWTQRVIWLGGLAVGAFSVYVMLGRPLRIPGEAWMLGAFWLWATTGALIISASGNIGADPRYSRLILQFVVIMVLMANALRRTGELKWFWLACVLAATYHVIFQPGGVSAGVVEGLDTSRLAVVGAGGSGQNTLGWYGFFGAMGGLILIGEAHKFRHRVFLIVGVGLSVLAVVASASRGGFVAAALSFVLWPVMCLRIRMRGVLVYLVAVSMIFVVCFVFMERVYSGSYLGKRMSNVGREYGSAHSRLTLARIAFELWARNPVAGVGLGRFGTASGTGMYAHSEAAELLATTGLVGAGLYFGMYWMIWRRLARSLRKARSSLLRYRVNCLRMALIVIVISGLLFKPHFLVIASIFLISLVVAGAHWAEGASDIEARFYARGISEPGYARGVLTAGTAGEPGGVGSDADPPWVRSLQRRRSGGQ